MRGEATRTALLRERQRRPQRILVSREKSYGFFPHTVLDTLHACALRRFEPIRK